MSKKDNSKQRSDKNKREEKSENRYKRREALKRMAAITLGAACAAFMPKAVYSGSGRYFFVKTWGNGAVGSEYDAKQENGHHGVTYITDVLYTSGFFNYGSVRYSAQIN